MDISIRNNKEIDIESNDYLKKCSLIAEVIKGEIGKKFIKFLQESYLMQPVADPKKDSSEAYFREGENNLIRQLIAMKHYGDKK